MVRKYQSIAYEEHRSVSLREENLRVRVDITENCFPLLTESPRRRKNKCVHFGTKMKNRLWSQRMELKPMGIFLVTMATGW